MAAARRCGRDVSGILLLDKPPGQSSNQALQRARRLFNANKAGHTGNLDVLASGLLPLCFGEATKVCQFLLDADKHYAAVIRFGSRTSTGDAEGEILAQRDASGLDAARVGAAMTGFVGTQQQVPPMYSALKRDGQPLYRLARQGITVEREPRQVEIREFVLRDFADGAADVEVRCSKGTYIRTLAEELGETLGVGAHLAMLRRLGAGPFRIESACTPGALEQRYEAGGFSALDALLVPMDAALPHLPALALDADQRLALGCGQQVSADVADVRGLVRLYDQAGEFFGIGESAADGCVKARRLLSTAVP